MQNDSEKAKPIRTKLKAKRKLDKSSPLPNSEVNVSATNIETGDIETSSPTLNGDLSDIVQIESCSGVSGLNEEFKSVVVSLKSFEDLRITDDGEKTNEILNIFRQAILQSSTLLMHHEKLHVKKQAEVDILKAEVSQLKDEVKNLQEWQNIAYNELQKANSNIQHYSNLMLSQRAPKKDNNKISSCRNKIKSSDPVFYAGSANSKKLNERKKLNENEKKVDLTKDDEQINNSDVNVIDDSENNSVSIGPKLDVLNQSSEKMQNKENNSEAIISTENESSIADALRKTAESAVSNSGFVYDAISGLYYDWNLKMYYDPSTKLYYDHENGVYYYYDNEKNTFIFHSQVEINKTENNDKNIEMSSMLSDGEIESDGSDEDVIDPCIRVMVLESNCLDIGSLNIITATGANIGKASENTISIDDPSVDQFHGEVIFNKNDKTFYLKNKSTSKIFVNDGDSFDNNSEPVEILHQDKIKFGNTIFSFHIHLGLETCHDCEPGNIQAVLLKAEEENKLADQIDLNSQRKAELKLLRKKYNIKPGYIPKKLIDSVPDRAGQRRKDVGSEPYDNKEVPMEKASIHKEIPENNLGHKMLAKMGWKSGEGLGKQNKGITTPVAVNVLQKNQGLGAGGKSSIENPKLKPDKWDKARERFNKL